MALSANELRIGNLLQGDKIYLVNQGIYSDGIFAITGYGISELEQGRLLKAEAIPLTEEWLLKFGFVEERTPPLAEHGKFYSKFNYDCKYSLSYAKFRGDWGFYHSYTDAIKESENNKFDFISCGIKYVHQLQNLFFAITGEELKY